jgi:hypothetical protein
MKNVKYILSGHNSFYLRDGWLHKGYNLIKNEEVISSSIFSKSNTDTIDELGLGSMMVQSVRFWMYLLGIIEKKSATTYRVSEIAKKVFEYDPYLQNNNTLWLLHINIFNLQGEKPILWEGVFEKDSNYNNFSREELDSYMEVYLNEKAVKASKKTLKDCISTFLNMYSSKVDMSLDPEENLHSPFSKLGYLIEEGDLYRFRNISFKEISEFLIYLVLSRRVKGEQMQLSEGYKLVNKVIRMSFVDYEKLISKLENRNMLKIDRAAGLENIIFTNLEVSEMEIITEILEGESR